MKHLVLLTMLILTLLATACGADTATESQSDAAHHTYTITATEEGWDATEDIPAGWTEIVLTNQSDFMRQAAFLRLDDDRTMADVANAVEAGMEGVPPWMTSYGGVSGVMPGETRRVTVNLPAGQYIVIDPVPEPDGVPGMAKGYFMAMTVEDNETATAPPSNDLLIELLDYSFQFDHEAIEAGTYTLRVTNSGPQEAHEVVIIRLDEGANADDFIRAMAPDAPPGPPPGQIVAGTAAFDTETENYVDVTFEAGATYAFICFTASSVHAGEPHFMHGMVAQFDVPG